MKEFQVFQEKFRNMLRSNGWVPESESSCENDTEDFTVYVKILSWQDCKSSYDIVVQAWVSDNMSGIEFCGGLGVCDIEIEGYRNAPAPYDARDLTDFLRAIQVAEEQLLENGIPFSEEYKFVEDADRKTEKNRENRKTTNLEAAEQEANALV